MSTVAVTNETQALVEDRRIDWIKSLPFFGVHAVCLAAFVTGVSWKAVGLCLALYVIRMFGITAGYHRYFAHRSYRTSRVFQFVMAWLGCYGSAEGTSLVGIASSAPPPTFRPGDGCALTGARRLLVVACRLDLVQQV